MQARPPGRPRERVAAAAAAADQKSPSTQRASTGPDLRCCCCCCCCLLVLVARRSPHGPDICTNARCTRRDESATYSRCGRWQTFLNKAVPWASSNGEREPACRSFHYLQGSGGGAGVCCMCEVPVEVRVSGRKGTRCRHVLPSRPGQREVCPRADCALVMLVLVLGARHGVALRCVEPPLEQSRAGPFRVLNSPGHLSSVIQHQALLYSGHKVRVRGRYCTSGHSTAPGDCGCDTTRTPPRLASSESGWR